MVKLLFNMVKFSVSPVSRRVDLAPRYATCKLWISGRHCKDIELTQDPELRSVSFFTKNRFCFSETRNSHVENRFFHVCSILFFKMTCSGGSDNGSRKAISGCARLSAQHFDVVQFCGSTAEALLGSLQGHSESEYKCRASWPACGWHR